MRKNFDETVAVLREVGIVDVGQQPRIPTSMPQYDDEDPCGFSVFRMGLEGADLSNLEMPRTFFSKSEVAKCDFTNSNLAESNLCWNDFINVKFVGADLSAADLRNSVFEGVDFTSANLSRADLRQSEFNSCTFGSANLAGAKLSKMAGEFLRLSAEQRSSIDWQDTEGEEAPGG